MEETPKYKPGDTIFQTYTVYRSLRGGYGDIYFCLKLNTLPVVLKTLRTSRFRSKIAQHAIYREAERWISLGKHPNIVQCHLFDNFDATPFLELEWVISDVSNDLIHSSLRHRMQRLVGVKASLLSAIYICRGLVHMQTKAPGMIHQDLKPENILVDERGVAKITDFGLAEIAKHENSGGETSRYETRGYQDKCAEMALLEPPHIWHLSNSTSIVNLTIGLICILLAVSFTRC